MPRVRKILQYHVSLLNCYLLEIEIDRMRHIRLHERVNDLPDANYATLKYFLGHLYKYKSVSSRYTTLNSTNTCVGQDLVA